MNAFVNCTAQFASFVPTYALLVVWLLVSFAVVDTFGVGEVIFAVNCGGDAHIDSNGIHYQKDWLKVGYASEHGRNLNIRRIPPQDQILYQTERYHVANFAYDVPVKSDGDYVLVLKFSEVWFTEAGRKVLYNLFMSSAVVHRAAVCIPQRRA